MFFFFVGLETLSISVCAVGLLSTRNNRYRRQSNDCRRNRRNSIAERFKAVLDCCALCIIRMCLICSYQ